MSKWASRWPGEYAFKDGPSRRGPDRQHKSTIKPTVALVDHKADDVEKRYREIRLRQKEIERQRRRSFVMEAQAPPRPPSPAKPRLPPGHGREPQRVQRMRKLFNSAITDAVSLCLRRCVSRLEWREERRIFRAKVAAGRFLPPVPASSRAVADALHDLLDPGKKAEAEKARKEIERLARQREERAARLVEFDAAKEDAADASHMVQKARHEKRDLEAAYHHARDRAAQNESEELQEAAQAAKKALDDANHEVTELLHHQREQEHIMAKAAQALERTGVSVFHLEQDREEQKKIDAGDEHAKAHQRKTRLKAKFRKAGGMAGLLKTSTHALAEGGKGLIKKKSYLAETMFDALSGDERAWVGASLLLADCLEDVDIRALPCVSPACGRFAAPHMERSRAALAMQKARRAALDRRTYWARVKDSRATKAIQKASRTIKGMRDTYALGAASSLFKLASEELGPSVAAFLGEFCRLPLQKFAALEPCGAFGDRPRAEAIAAALSSLSFSEELACLLTPFLVDTIIRQAPMPKHRHREAPLSPDASVCSTLSPLARFAAAPKSPPTSPVQKRPPSAKPPARPPPPNKTPTERRVYFPDDQSADADSLTAADSLTVDEITVASVAETLNTEDASDDELDEDACVATAQTLDALGYAVARSRACHPPFLRASNRRLFSVAFRCPDPGVRRSAAACACAIMTNLERLRLAPNELNDAASASSQALAHEAVAHGLPALIKAMMRNVDGDFVESGLDVLSATCVDLEAPRFHAAYRAGAPRYVQALLLRLALDQYLCGPNTPDTKRDRMARKAGSVLCSLYTDARCRRNAVEEDAHIVCSAALMACQGWIFGQQLGCILAGTMAEQFDIQRSLAPLIPVLAKLMGEVQAAPEVNLAAKIALRTCTYTDENWSKERKAPAWFLASKLDDAGLVGTMEAHLYHDPREHILPDEPWSALPVNEYDMPQDFYGLPPILPQSHYGNPTPPGWYPAPVVPGPAAAPAPASAVPEGVASPAARPSRR